MDDHVSRTLIACLAHPDDEAFGFAGTLRRAADAGWRTVLVCATRGEVGEISDPALATPETLGTVREAEMRCAAGAVGLHDLVWLDWRDSGMAGTAENADPRAFMNAPAHQIVEQLTALFRAEQPEIVVTFDPSGGYGHPDHIAIHRHCLAAVAASSDSGGHRDLGSSWDGIRGYYVVFPRSAFATLRDAFLANGGSQEEIAQFDRPDIGFADEDVDVWLDVSDTVPAKLAAMGCHRTQFGDNDLFARVPDELRQQLMSREAFARFNPDPRPGQNSVDVQLGL